MAGGGTGGHVMPLLAVARLLAARGHRVVFAGTRAGIESRLVPAAGFPLEWIEAGAWQRVPMARRVRTLWQIPMGVWAAWRLLGRERAAAVLSLGGYVAAPVVAAAILRGVPVVALEPNAMPGMVNRLAGRWVRRALVGFEETRRWFPAGLTEVTGVPVRAEFFALPARAAVDDQKEWTKVLTTGGSRGSRTLNEAFRASWPLFQRAGARLRFRHQSGVEAQAELAAAFARTGLAGSVDAFIDDMPAAFVEADLIVGRTGANAVGELTAASKPAIAVPFPFAADGHQKKNAEALVRAGGAVMVEDRDLTGQRFFDEVMALASDPARRMRMGAAAHTLARPDAAERAAAVLEEVAGRPA